MKLAFVACPAVLCLVLPLGFAASGQTRSEENQPIMSSLPGVECRDFQRAPKLSAGMQNGVVDHPVYTETRAIWTRLLRTFRLSAFDVEGMSVDFAPLSLDAVTIGGEPFGPQARICFDPTTIFLTYDLLKMALVDRRDVLGPDYIAFVLAHELGHLLNRPKARGSEIKRFEGPDGEIRETIEEEAYADQRAVYFTALAGFDTRKILTAVAVRAFLVATCPGISGAQLDAREDSFSAAVGRFDQYEWLYQVGMLAALAGRHAEAELLLRWAADLMASSDAIIPEILIAYALAIMANNRQGPSCVPVYPGTTALYDESASRAPMVLRGALDLEPAEKIKRAIRLLDAAAAAGGSELVTLSARACANFYLGDDARARLDQDDAEKLAAHAPDKVRKALAANRRLMEGRPVQVKSSGRQNAVRPSVGVHVGTQFPGKTELGSCPAGWDLDFSIPSRLEAADSGSEMGMTTCRRQGDRDQIWTQVMIGETIEFGALDLRVVAIIGLDGESRDLATWKKSCESIQVIGASDGGGQAYTVRNCETAGGAFSGLLLLDAVGGVRAVARFEQ